MSNFPIIFLILAAVVLVFGFGVVVQSRRKKATPVIAPAPKKVVSPAPVAETVAEPVVEAAPVVAEPVVEKKRSFKNVLAGAVSSVLGRGEINDTSWDDLEEALLRADVGAKVAQALLEPLRARVKAKEISHTSRTDYRVAKRYEFAPYWHKPRTEF
jgi:fused signal recognition particle receptor